MALINRRYQLQGQLGVGEMGTVYRAYDRMAGQIVALKRVVVQSPRLAPAAQPDDNPDALLLALAQEFKLLASLRHPHIISVLDYGFDADRQPFFTMELLDQPRTLLEAGFGQPLSFKIQLLIETLHALAYLHRRNILHHDLKPENVLVSAGHVRLLDFGLAVTHDQQRAHDRFGTLLYMPPEVLAGERFTVAGDLYAFGVIAYELLVGHHPFKNDDLSEFLDRVFESSPDLTPLHGLPALAEMLGQLLMKAPDQRPPDAQSVIAQLCAAVEWPLPTESVAIRESFLQAANFVGREAELGQLTGALDRALHGRGSAWLLGGESGVGKSRLLDELRTRALVAGALVVHGHAVDGVGLPYQIWREPLRRLVLSVDLSDLEAGILAEVIPDLETLLGRRVPVAPALSGESGRQRLMLTIANIFRRLPGPVVLLLEDLQWVRESAEPLKLLLRHTSELPLLVVGSYRDDEQRNLPAELPQMRVIKLLRLGDQAIRELSTAMLGEAGAQPQLINLLQRETEGNTFFMVEVVRALAEEAGSLTDIGRATLPLHVFTGGIRHVIRRRLARVPAAMRPLLQLAAVAGRQVDPVLLEVLPSSVALPAWLTACAEATVLEVYDNQWRFAHDKLREAIIADLSDIERPALHRQVAEALERIYPGDPTLAEVLMEHWRAAGDAARELTYILVVVERWVDYDGNYHGARGLIERGLTLAASRADADRQRMALFRWLGQAYEYLSDYAASDRAYELSQALAERLGDQAGLAATLRGMGRTAWRQGHLRTAQQRCEQALALYRALGSRKGIADCLSGLGNYYGEQGDLPKLEAYLQQSLSLYQELGDQDGIYGCFNDLGVTAGFQGDIATERADSLQALSIARAINSPMAISTCLLNLGQNAINSVDWSVARDYTIEALVLARELGDQLGIGIGEWQLGIVALELEQFDEAQTQLMRSLEIFRTINALAYVADTWSDLGLLAQRQGDYTGADEYYNQALTIARPLGQPGATAEMLARRGWLSIDRRDLVRARQDLGAALEIAHRYNFVLIRLSALLLFGQLYLLEHQPERAAELAGLADGQAALMPLARKRYLLPLRTQLATTLSADAYAAAAERGRALELIAATQAILAEHGQAPQPSR